MPDNAPHNALRHHISGAIARGEAAPVTECRIPSPTWGDMQLAHSTVWAALELLPEGSLSDEERDDVATAMAWIAEELGIEP